ncbi:dienelactone hydrolase family protein [Rhodococcus sp. WMMA185]|uniref:dienelactone hydrolase family protein n=1 Tax=Rhodococcus sp. WMMA185 TaxID=679318 RepID=UPI000AADF2B6|nr:dienelactone hydrolase family protein [Rhodococcus sp. WMMA185]
MSDIDLTEVAARHNGSRTLQGYLVRPPGEGPWPGVVMVHEAFGLEDVMRRQADRLASAGFLTLAPDLFSAGGARRCLVSTMRAMLSGKGRAYGDIEAARQWLSASAECTGKIGVIGFCMGGGFALMVADSGFDAAAPNYGTLPRDLDAAMGGACPVVASYGGKDFSLKKAAAKLDVALTKAGVVHDVREYPTAGHGFLNDEVAGPKVIRPLLKVAGMVPDPDAATDAWARIDAFFREHLG